MLMQILKTLTSEFTEVYKEKIEDVKVSVCILDFRSVEMCLYKDCSKVKMADKAVLKREID